VTSGSELPVGAPRAGGQHSFIETMPKAELHLHLEGTLEPGLRNRLAARNQLAPAATGTNYTDLTSFLAEYYAAMDVLRTEQDFYDLAMAYFRKASEQQVVYAEIFFDPQAHTSRGIAFDTVINGIDRARNDAGPLHVQLIMCFLRDKDAGDAMRTLEQAAPHRAKITGVGLDSDERDNPPVKFKQVFAAARDEGYRLTMHCDVDQQDSVRHIWQCLDEIGVERIDHGVNCLEDSALVERLANDEIGLTVCPISNRWVTDGLKAAELKSMLDHGLKATVNSDDPAYFGGYITENFLEVAQAAGLTQQEVEQLARNAFDISWR
jgi:adenosine deaminase